MDKESVQKFIVEHLHSEHGVAIGPNDSLRLAGIDSVAMAEMTLELEREFEFKIDQDVLDTETIAELAEYVIDRKELE